MVSYICYLENTLKWRTDRINLPLFSTVVPACVFMFLSCRPFVAITTLSKGLVGVEVTSVSWLGQLTGGHTQAMNQQDWQEHSEK